MKTISLLLVLFFLSIPRDASAQQAQATAVVTTANDVRILEGLAFRGIVLRGVSDPFLGSGVSAPKPEIVLVVQNDGKTAAKARLGWISGRFLADVTVTGPISGGSLLSHEGVSAGTSIRVRAQYVRWDLKEPQAFATEVVGIARTARSAAPTPERTAELTVRELETASERVLRRGVETTLPVFLSAAFEFGSDKHKFIDAVTLANASTTEEPWAATASLGVLLARKTQARSAEAPGVFLGASVEFYERYKPNPERNICRPIGTGGFECDKFRIGAPQLQSGQSISVESRLWLDSANIGLNPTVAYDVADSVWNVELPVYFLKLVADADKPIFSKIPDLAGGVSVGWRSGTEKGFYAVFLIGPTFKLPSPK